MNSSSVLNVCLVLAIMGLAWDASANLINCNKASAKWSEPVTECEQSVAEIRKPFNFSPSSLNTNSHSDVKHSFFLTEDDLSSAQFVIGSITGNQLAALCNDKSECNKGAGSLARYYAGNGVIKVSEPAPLLLILLGLLGLGLVRRRLR